MSHEAQNNDIERLLPDPQHALTLTLDTPISTAKLIRVALWRGLCRKQGELSVPKFGELKVVSKETPLLATRLTAYKQICGDEDVEVPPVFVQSLYVQLIAKLLIHPAFPVSPYGLIHMRQTITAYRPIRQDALLDCELSIKELRRTSRGIELDCLQTAYEKGELVWEGVATYLTRNAATQARSGGKREKTGEEALPQTKAQFDVPDDIGRRYAYVSGDYNLIHLYPWSAKLMGFKRAIAHGIWTLGRAVSALPAETRRTPFSLDVSFKRPLFLPGAVGLVYDDAQGPEGLSFQIVTLGTSNAHLTGTIAPLKR